MKRILITGATSYVGSRLESYLSIRQETYRVDKISLRDGAWMDATFHGYDTVFHAAGIAHSDNGKISDARKALYYAVNTRLTIDVATKAKADGVKQFVFMSSAIIYGESAPMGKQKLITSDTVPQPANVYGDSKLQAENGIRALADEDFHVVILRCPMIYGEGCRGNYRTLAKIAQKMPVFPRVRNARSMLYIDNLCEFVRLLIDKNEAGIFWPQNSEYSGTSEMVGQIAAAHGKKIRFTKAFNWGLYLLRPVTGLVDKAFGNLTFDQRISKYSNEYRLVSRDASIYFTETGKERMKKVLVLASVASMIDQFNMPYIALLREMGYVVNVACNFTEGSTCSVDKIQKLKAALSDLQVKCCQIDFARDITKLGRNLRAYKQVKALLSQTEYSFIHCHSPIGGLVGRMAGHKTRAKVIYTAHGFHFYKGAPLKNWLLYYPVEWLCAHWTDVLITINQADFELAKKKLNAGRTVYIPGVGVDVGIFAYAQTDRAAKRAELGLPADSFVLISTGELNDNKNHITVIEALASLHAADVHYIIAGIGGNEARLNMAAQEFGVGDRVHLLGYRTDIPQLLKASDAFCFPSKREGLGLGAIEAMASGLPLLTSNVGGINDYSEDGVTGFKYAPTDIGGFAQGILKLKNDPALRGKMGKLNIDRAKRFSIESAVAEHRKVYESL